MKRSRSPVVIDVCGRASGPVGCELVKGSNNEAGERAWFDEEMEAGCQGGVDGRSMLFSTAYRV